MSDPNNPTSTASHRSETPTHRGLDFDRPVAPGGYAWWYVDALSDDGLHGLTMILMIGSVFSPYYAKARRQGSPNAEDHSAINVALYGKGGKRWALTERDAKAIRRAPNELHVGPSSVSWNGHWLEIKVNEMTVPVPRRLRGTIRVHPTGLNESRFDLARSGRHTWWPIAPISRVEVEMRQPSLRWRGDAYLDANWGAEALEAGFDQWDWSRGMLDDGRCAVLYNRQERAHKSESLALLFDQRGTMQHFEPPHNQRLPHTRIWRIPRGTQAEPGFTPRVAKTLEDTPFYARSIIHTRLLGQPVTAVHESLCLRRFSQRWVQMLLPFRMPRVRGKSPR